MTAVTVYYCVPDSEDIELDDAQQALWDAFQAASREAGPAPWRKFIDSIKLAVEYPDLIEDVDVY